MLRYPLKKMVAASMLCWAISMSAGCTTPISKRCKNPPQNIEQKIAYKGYEGMEKDLGAYYTYEEQVENMENLTAKYSNIVSTEKIGESWFNRPIYVLKISDKDNFRDESEDNSLIRFIKKVYYWNKKPTKKKDREPQLLFNSQIHARELISGAVNYKIAEYLAENYDKIPEIKKYVDNNELYFILVSNPDGLAIINGDFQPAYDAKKLNDILMMEKTEEELKKIKLKDDSWRKNARDNNNDGIIISYGDGVDLNRNFSVGWGITRYLTEDYILNGWPGSADYEGPFDEKDDDNDWTAETDDLNKNGKPDVFVQEPGGGYDDYIMYDNDESEELLINKYKPEPHVNEDPIDLIDNDGDGLIDEDPAGGFTEPETKAIKKFVESLDNLVIAADFHSYSGLILYPPGFKEFKTKDEALLRKIGEGMRDRQPYEKFEVKNSYELYIAGGTFKDWLYFDRKAIAFTIELYKQESQGWADDITAFNPPQEKIQEEFENMLPAILYLMEIADNPQKVLEEKDLKTQE